MRWVPGLVLFAFKKSAEKLIGPFVGNGFMDEAGLGTSDVFVMPGPYERASVVDERLVELGDYWQRSTPVA
jgi:hypothetical protein